MTPERIEEALAWVDASSSTSVAAVHERVLAAALREAQAENARQRKFCPECGAAIFPVSPPADEPDDGYGGDLWKDRRHHLDAYNAGPPADEAKR